MSRREVRQLLQGLWAVPVSVGVVVCQEQAQRAAVDALLGAELAGVVGSDSAGAVGLRGDCDRGGDLSEARTGVAGLSGGRDGSDHARMQRDLATLVPNARLGIASQSGHYVHQDQPELVIEAIREVVAGVRDRATWYDQVSCCAN